MSERKINDTMQCTEVHHTTHDCPDDADYECYGCGQPTGRGYDEGLCYHCGAEEGEL